MPLRHLFGWSRHHMIAVKKVVVNLYAELSTMTSKIADYGTWLSPITTQMATENCVRFYTADLAVDDGAVFWNESRPSEKGRSAVCSWTCESNSITTWTPEGFSARTRVNEYGGGAFFVCQRGVIFSNFKDQRLYLQSSPSSEPQPLTPEDSGHCYAAGLYSKKYNKILCVREDHSVVKEEKSKEPENTIVSIDPDNQEQKVLVSGADFYSGPKLSYDGKYIAWMQWNHPNMPWDDTEIWKAEMNADGTSIIRNTLEKVAGGRNISAMLPSWSPDGRLLYISDETNWWNLYEYLGDQISVPLNPREKEVGIPQWQYGSKSYDYHPTIKGQIVVNYGEELAILDTVSRSYRQLDIAPLNATSSLIFAPDGYIYMVAHGPETFACIVQVDPKTEQVNIIHRSNNAVIDKGYISVAETISFPTSDDQIAYGHLYLPQNKDYVAPKGTLPPLLVRAHGGPTAKANTSLDLKHQYLTSRGFAILDVDYRGSTGYGRIYRESLNSWWGVYDMEDVCNGALHLVNQNLVDGKRLAIDGGSAGGLTTLAALTFKDVFQAGVSYYGVSDLEALFEDTHKFESQYTINLVGPYPEAKSVYVERSPVNHVDKLNTPMAFFQGGEDKVVLPAQSERMFEALKAKGLPTAYVFFPTEQHGFREAKNLQAAMEGELYFFAKIFGFEPPDIAFDMIIHNLKL